MQTLCTALERTAARYPERTAYSDRHRSTTWAQFRAAALDAAAGLVRHGLRPGELVAIMAGNRVEHVVADAAAVHAGAIPMSVYATLAPEQVAAIAAQSRPTVVVLEGTDQLRRWSAALDGVRTIVVLDPDAVPDDQRALSWAALERAGRKHPGGCADRRRAVTPDAAMTVLYTSGTTGDPKGVVLTHANVLHGVAAAAERAELGAPGRTISYLPYAHIAERILSFYLPQVRGDTVHLLDDPAGIGAALTRVRPTRFFGVPRVWEKLRSGLHAVLAESSRAERATVDGALAVGLRYVESRQYSGETSAALAEEYRRADASVLRGLRARLGLDEVTWATSAAAPMPVELTQFFGGLGLRIFDVYGMTETTGSVTANGPAAFRLGSVGRPLPGVELRVDNDGEILLRGPLITPGYFANPTATAELFGPGGWLRTGDVLRSPSR
jgi:long-chain acyl-CoA synthetase